MKLSDFLFTLPDRLIAQHPIDPPDHARLLCVDGMGGVTHRHFYDLKTILKKGDVLVINNTRVIPSRIVARRENPKRTRSKIEPIDWVITFHEFDLPNHAWGFQKKARRLKEGQSLISNGVRLVHAGKDRHKGIYWRIENLGERTLFDWLETDGQMPLPPYIERGTMGEAGDKTDYQAIFAERNGSVAAPTASLHFTAALMDDLKAMGVETVHVTLHVGAGTYQTIRAEDIREHEMHAEYGEVTPEAAAHINTAKAEGRRIIPVGTTAMRVLESASQTGRAEPFADETRIFIYPGYDFKMADCLITNFHLPGSSLFMLVSALCGLDVMKAAYAQAIEREYRFFSYGDACFLEKTKTS